MGLYDIKTKLRMVICVQLMNTRMCKKWNENKMMSVPGIWIYKSYNFLPFSVYKKEQLTTYVRCALGWMKSDAIWGGIWQVRFIHTLLRGWYFFFLFDSFLL